MKNMYCVCSVWHNGNGHFKHFMTNVLAVDNCHADGLHQKSVRENNSDIKTGCYVLFICCSIVNGVETDVKLLEENKK